MPLPAAPVRPTGRSSASRPHSPSGGDLASRNRRVMRYRQLVRPLAVHYARQCQESCEDLIQVGLLGLIRAAELYDGDRCTPFEAFARPHIRGAILHYLRDAAPAVRLPRRQAELQDRLRRLQAAVGQGDGVAGSRESLCRVLGVNLEQLSLLEQQRQLLRPCHLSPVLSEQLSTEADPAAADGLETLAARAFSPCTGRALGIEEMLGLLDPRQRLVVAQVVLAGWSYRRVAGQLGVSPMTVQRQLRQGLARLRQQLDALAADQGGIRSGRSPVPSDAPGC